MFLMSRIYSPLPSPLGILSLDDSNRLPQSGGALPCSNPFNYRWTYLFLIFFWHGSPCGNTYCAIPTKEHLFRVRLVPSVTAFHYLSRFHSTYISSIFLWHFLATWNPIFGFRLFFNGLFIRVKFTRFFPIFSHAVAIKIVSAILETAQR